MMTENIIISIGAPPPLAVGNSQLDLPLVPGEACALVQRTGSRLRVLKLKDATRLYPATDVLVSQLGGAQST